MAPAGRSRSAASKSRSRTSGSGSGSTRRTATASRATTTRRTSSSRSSSAGTRRGGAELTALESKVGEVLGLAMAAQGATKKVAGMTEDSTLKQTLERMGQEAAETEQRCTAFAGTLDGKKAAILKKARETKKEATEMMSTYLGRDSDALDGFEFLTMAEAGEVGHWAIVETLQRMAEEAGEAEERGTEVAERFDGKKTAILEEARTVKSKATEMMSTYLDDDADALDGFEFLTMAEASEVGHWSVLRTLNERAGNSDIKELADWQLPIQQRHFQEALQGSVALAAEEDPNEPA